MEIPISLLIFHFIFSSDHENVDPAPNAAKFVLANEDLEDNFAEIITDQKNETWLFIDGFRYKKLTKTDDATK